MKAHTDLAIRDLAFAYGERQVLDGLTVDFPSQSLAGIVGPNGCGKSTLVSLLANLRAPSRGEVLVDGGRIQRFSRRALAKKIAFLPQAPLCPRGMTVAQVLRHGREPHQSLLRQFSADDARKVCEIVELLQLGPFLDRQMSELSGGQRQKAWLGMVMVQDTDVLLLDEPTSALDIGHQHEVLECIRLICDAGKTVILVIHDLAAAARFCDRLLALKSGCLRAFGEPSEVVSEELILDLYGIEVEILRSPVGAVPVIVPLRLQRGRVAP